MTGSLDLAQAKVGYPVTLTDCTFERIVLTEADFPQLHLVHCKVGEPDHWAGELEASHLSITGGDLELTRFHGVVNLGGAHIRDDLHLEGARLAAKAGDTYALKATNLRLGGNFCGSSTKQVAHASGGPRRARFRARGTLLLEDARIDGSVYLIDAVIGRTRKEPKYAVSADGMTVGGSLYGSRLEAHGQVRLVGATIGGSCEFRGARIHRGDERAQPHEGAVMMDRAGVDGSLFCDRGFVCTGTFHAKGMRVSTTANFNGATIIAGEKSGGAALQLDRSVVGGVISMDRGGTTRRTGDYARRYRRRIAPGEPADGKLRFWTEGAVTLTGAKVGLDVHLDITGVRGDETALTGSGKEESVTVVADLTRLQTTILRLSAEQGPARRAPDGGLVDLTQAKLVVLWDQNTVWQGPGPPARGGLCYVLKGLQYDAVHANDVPFGPRLRWLATSACYARSGRATDREIASYTVGAPAPQPYDQFAAAYGAAGRDDDSRTVLLKKNEEIERHRRKVPRDHTGPWWQRAKDVVVAKLTTVWNFFQRYLIGYGYRPLRALVSLLILWGIGVIVFFLVPPDPYVRQTVITEKAAELPPMNWVEHFTYPADLLIPLVGFGEKDRWHPADSGTAFLASALVVAGWFLGATVLVSITRVVRRQ
ncbi:hypothetical protein ABTX81_24015 [Kitasatospora sp. NPDC097605]|uniref:hypothetical protein n=1 Tax=Kitasatospora sp. NPDC097605 TaxID=3157226 RepID=UPI003325960E